MKQGPLGRPMRPLAAPVLAAAALLLAGCASPTGGDADVLATFYPLAFAAQRLAGDNLTVGTIVPSGVEPHDWEPSPNDAARLGKAGALLTQGGGFEPWLDGLLANIGQPRPHLIVTTADIELEAHEDEEAEEGHDGELDPHTWLAPRLFERQVAAAEDGLAERWPEHAGAIRERGATLRAELLALADEYDQGLATCEARVIVANHDAYSYLAHEYDFEVVSLSGLSPEAEPDPVTLAQAIDVARQHNITIIFFEELVSPRVAQIVAREVGAQTRVLSPIESAPESGDYLSMSRENLANLREAMRCT